MPEQSRDADSIKDRLTQLITEPDPGWVSVTWKLRGKLTWAFRQDGLSALEGVVRLLTNDSPETQFRAAYLFGHVVQYDRSVFSKLPSNLPELAHQWIRVALRAPNRQPFSEVVILRLIEGFASEAAVWAAEGLVVIGKADPGVMPLLLNGVKHANPNIRGWCALSVDHLDDCYASHAEEYPIDEAAPLINTAAIDRVVSHEGMLSPLIDAVCDSEVTDALRGNALGRLAHAAAGSPDQIPSCVAKLRKVLHKRSQESAQHAAIALGKVAPAEAQDALPVLLGVLTDDFRSHAVLAAEALIAIDRRYVSDPKVVEILDSDDGGEGYA